MATRSATIRSGATPNTAACRRVSSTGLGRAEAGMLLFEGRLPRVLPHAGKPLGKVEDMREGGDLDPTPSSRT